MRYEKDTKGLQTYAIGLLLLGATCVISLLQLGREITVCFLSIKTIAVLLMAAGLLSASTREPGFRGAAVIFVLDGILSIALVVLAVIGLAGRSEMWVTVEFDIMAATILMDIIGTILTLSGCRCLLENERFAGRTDKWKRKTHGYGLLYALVMLGGPAVPIGLSLISMEDDRITFYGITGAAVVVFLVSVMVACLVFAIAGHGEQKQ